MKSDKPQISIVIPFYNSEKTLMRCLESICLWTTVNYEIVCIDDGSSDKSVDIVKKVQSIYSQIKLFRMRKNRGLYLARLKGINKSHGRYIGFLDSDDYVSRGYYDELLFSAERNDSDICVGQIINVNSEGVSYLQSRCAEFPYLLNNEKLKSIYEMYWRQAGRCYHWHVVWNKIYKRELFRQKLKILKRQREHLVMAEDFIYSSIIFDGVKSFSVSKNARYFYVDNPRAQTKNRSMESIQKSLVDLKHTFGFVEKYLMNSNANDMCLACFFSWKDLYHKIWKNNILEAGFSEDISEKVISDFWENYPLLGRQEVDNYYYEIAEIVDN